MLSTAIQLHSIDLLLLVTYFLFVLGIGFVLRRTVSGSQGLLRVWTLAPAWICALGFIGRTWARKRSWAWRPSGAKYGMMTSHFYWIGARPGHGLVASSMMPFYYGSKARSVPEYLKLRFDEKNRGFNALTFACITIHVVGDSMYALAKLLNASWAGNFHGCHFRLGRHRPGLPSSW